MGESSLPVSTTSLLLQKCNLEYEEIIQKHFFTAETVADLDDYHQKAKQQIFDGLPNKWKEMKSTKEVPLTFISTLDRKLEDVYDQLKDHFEKFKSKKQGDDSTATIRRATIEHYKNDMDRYMDKHPMASPKEIQMQHHTVVGNVIARIKETFKGTLRVTMIADLRISLDVCRLVYENKAKMNMSSLVDPAIGIDLGTTNCCVMVCYKGKIQLVKNTLDGLNTTPSYVAFHPDGTDTFGNEAKEAGYRNPEITIYDAKRMIGRAWDDQKLQQDRRKWAFEIENDNNNPKIITGNISRYPHEVSARLLTRFRDMTEQHLNLPAGSITKAVITVPAYFTEPQRRATAEAANCAGLEVLNILSEPSAAAIAYNYDKVRAEESRKVLIYDLGGGTFDVAIAEVKTDAVNILGVDGDTHLGGQDFDQLLMEYCLEQFKNQHSLDVQSGRNSPDTAIRMEAKSALCRLKLQCELAKERLTTVQKTTIEVEQIYQGKDLIVSVTREKLEKLVNTLIDRTLEIVERAISAAKGNGLNSIKDIDEIILVGGATRIPLVVQKVSTYFRGKPICKSIDPDQAVAYGAAIQAAIMNCEKDMKNIVVQDVIPLAVGIEKVGNRFAMIIPKNTQLPCVRKKLFATTLDNQLSTAVKVYQGKAEFCRDNKSLGEFVFNGFLPRPKGEEQLRVTMTINAMGILQVEAESLSTTHKNAITINAERLGMDAKSMERVTKECAELTLE